MGGIYESTPLRWAQGAVIFIPRFINIGSGIQKLMKGIHRQLGDLINLHVFFQNKGSRLIKMRDTSFWKPSVSNRRCVLKGRKSQDEQGTL
jgi:hypothetical protein